MKSYKRPSLRAKRNNPFSPEKGLLRRLRLLAMTAFGSLATPLFLVFLSQLAHGFPEMIRHGYSNCTSCHASPNGGGILTPYGRKLSEELLSHWAPEGSGEFLAGAVTLPKWLMLGGDVRLIQTYKDTPRMTQKRLILMQADVEAAATHKNFQAVATVGRQETMTSQPLLDEIFSRRHYVKYQWTETLSLRAGKFLPAVGLNLSDHYVTTRRGLGWDQGMESYNVEGAYTGDAWDLFATAVLGRIDRPSLGREKGGAIRYGRNIDEKHKIGVSYYYGTNDLRSRAVYGPYAILGFTERFFILTEIDVQHLMPSISANSIGVLGYLRADYEVLKGTHLYGGVQLSRTDLKDTRTFYQGYFIGAQWFPVPHVELNINGEIQRNNAISTDSNIQFGWLMAHVYL